MPRRDWSSTGERDPPRGRRSSWSVDDRVREGAEALDGEGHRVARLQVAAKGRVSDLEQAAAPDSARANEIAGPQSDVGRRAGQHLAEAEVGVGPAAPRRLDAVDLGGH